MLENKIAAFVKLGNFLKEDSEELLSAKKLASIKNPWFTLDNIELSLNNIADAFLDQTKLRDYLVKYPLNNKATKVIAMVPAGNIPLVGFHDILCILLSNNHLQIKLSEKDQVLTRLVLDKLVQFEPSFEKDIFITDRLKDFDAVIATGSNNSARYFEYYFGKKPNIIRKNRNSIAILDGNESEEQLLNLAKDIFSFFGLGCRNVSKLYVPTDYPFVKLLELYQQFAPLSNHSKYRNNIDYNIALFLLNKQHYLNNGCLILKEDAALASRIATLHYEVYEDFDKLKEHLNQINDDIQCIVSDKYSSFFDNGFLFGEAQTPSLNDYADGVDTMMFLREL